MVNKVLGIFMAPAHMAGASTTEQIAEVVWEAATDGKDQVRYIAGEDAKEMYAQRLRGWSAFGDPDEHRRGKRRGHWARMIR